MILSILIEGKPCAWLCSRPEHRREGDALSGALEAGQALGIGGQPVTQGSELESQVRIGLALAELGRFEESLEALEAAAVHSPEGRSVMLADFGYTYARAGRRAEALAVLGELDVLSQKEYVDPVDVAVVHAGLGNADQAMVWLEKTLGEESRRIAYAKVSPPLLDLHADPRFRDLLRRMGLPEWSLARRRRGEMTFSPGW